MEFKISKTEFLRGLRLAQNIADRKATMPLLANVLLRTVGKTKLLVAATDLNVSVTAELKSTNQGEGGITVSAKNLHELISNAPGDQISFKTGDNHWAEIKSAKASYRIVGMSDRDYPKVPDAREVAAVDMDAGALREMIDRTLFSVCNDETRFHLSGVFVESDGAVVRMVSTDGHRLSKVARTTAGPKLSAGVIVPKKGVVEWKRLLDGAQTVRVAVKTPFLFATNDDITLAVKLIDSQFPNYEQVIPKDLKRHVVIDRARLIESLRRSQLMSSETRGVKFALSQGTLTLTSDNPDMGEVREEIEVDYKEEDIAIGFNPKYLVELLGQISADQIAIHVGGELDPGVVRPVSGDDYVGVVMPMRI